MKQPILRLVRKFYQRTSKRHGHHIAITHVENQDDDYNMAYAHKKLYNDRKQLKKQSLRGSREYRLRSWTEQQNIG